MRVKVLFFAMFRDVVGARETTMTLGGRATVDSLLARLYQAHPELRKYDDTLLVAVNQDFVDRGMKLSDGDEVALMPPVSGGAGTVRIQRRAIDFEALVDSVHRHDAGAIVAFLGTVRSDPGVAALDYEVYEAMARKQMDRLADETKAKFGVLDVAIVHRLGRIAVGRPSVGIAISSRHRREAFAACEWLMEQLKRVVPIWKTERARGHG